MLNIKILGAKLKIDTKIDIDAKKGTFVMIYDGT